ncbi:MAG TPA: rhodanese-like domain-containing protein [Chitinophagales bacterium]|jgi:rhodanese-related sulfurtransferase|nr:rhodanese-like domain-containing protein [Chitinophagales bacterium]MBP6154946.1 rhodanese-like domain-containing protein [Chitinophagales bacterium]HQV76853.1 rhodanese-like domain-containing protein [Chitinophagales bacterium]HQW78080.1 rhodanese-like domain-containing protein [Chitinophagales bacterium]HRB69833.1 rhodanese-like domain-containing protein [Chitinophagales bacterium]
MAHEDLAPKEFLVAYNEQKENAVLLDVRTAAEIAEGSIEDHIAIDIQQPNFMEKVGTLDKSKTYFVYCRSGNRSGQACKYMATQGFEKLYNLKGGMMAWMETDFE